MFQHEDHRVSGFGVAVQHIQVHIDAQVSRHPHAVGGAAGGIGDGLALHTVFGGGTTRNQDTVAAGGILQQVQLIMQGIQKALLGRFGHKADEPDQKHKRQAEGQQKSHQFAHVFGKFLFCHGTLPLKLEINEVRRGAERPGAQRRQHAKAQDIVEYIPLPGAGTADGPERVGAVNGMPVIDHQ